MALKLADYFFTNMSKHYDNYIIDHKLLREWVVPRLGRFEHEVDNEKMGKGKLYFNPKHITPESILAHRVCSGGLMAGLTNKSRPWFAMQPSDPTVELNAEIQERLKKNTDLVNSILLKSNFYDETAKLYDDLTLFGQGCMMIEATLDNDVIHCQTFPQGSYFADINSKGYINKFARKINMNVLQIVEKFGLNALTKKMKIDYKEEKYSSIHQIKHIIFPNPDYIEEKDLQPSQKEKFKFIEYYYVNEENEFFLLKDGNYSVFPVMFPRWQTMGNDVYACGSPGIDCLGVCMQLQEFELSKLNIVELSGNIPYIAPAGAKLDLSPGGISIVDEEGQGLKSQVYPAFSQLSSIEPITRDIAKSEISIKRCFYVDLFSSLLSMPTNNMTAREVQERHEEKMLLLGSVLERLSKEFLDPAISRIFSILVDQGKIKDASDDWQPEYTSILHESMKANRSDDTKERFVQFLMALGQIDPKIIQSIKPYTLLELFAKDLGLPIEILKTELEYEQILNEINEQNQNQQQIELAERAINSAKTASETKNEDGSTLLDTAGGL